MTILVLEDKLGITSGYAGIWSQMLYSAGLSDQSVRQVSIWRSTLARNTVLLTRKGNRKSPGFNPSAVAAEAQWLREQIQVLNPVAILCMDVAMLGLVESEWDIAIIDNLRGGVYAFDGIPFVVTVPISAIHTQKKPKDIRAMNEGYESEADWAAAHGGEDMEDEEEFFFEPYTIPYGRWILGADLRKLARVIQKRQTQLV